MISISAHLTELCSLGLVSVHLDISPPQNKLHLHFFHLISVAEILCVLLCVVAT